MQTLIYDIGTNVISSGTAEVNSSHSEQKVREYLILWLEFTSAVPLEITLVLFWPSVL